MDLVIKPTNKCNFACTFCARGDPDRQKDMSLQNIYDFVDKYDYIHTIIFNGGDPLMMSPEYYFSIIDYVTKKHKDCFFSFTSNMWDFYKHPEKWYNLISQKNVGFITSFQLDNSRRLRDGTMFSIELFDKVQQTFFKYFNRHLDFISVLNDHNKDKYLVLIEIAKKYNCKCKLNTECESGFGKYFPDYEMFKIYLDLIKRGLDKYEHNCQLFKQIINKNYPFCVGCKQGIRCIGPDLNIHNCPSLNDDQDKFDINNSDWSSKYKFLKSECLSCEWFELCNGCCKKVFDAKNNNVIETHCKEIKQMLKDFKTCK